MNETQMKNKIMLRVYMMFVIRQLKNPLFLKLGVFVLSLLTINSIVSVGHIMANTPHNIVGMYHFAISAFMNTKVVVQVVTLALAVVGVLLLRDLALYINKIKSLRLRFV